MSETPPTPPQVKPTPLEKALERLRDHDAFRVVIRELRGLREDQFQALKNKKKREVFEIVGAISMLDDIIAAFDGPS